MIQFSITDHRRLAGGPHPDGSSAAASKWRSMRAGRRSWSRYISMPAIASTPMSPQRNRDQLRRIQLVYQSPDIALNPRQTIETILGRPLAFYFGLRGNSIKSRVRKLLDLIDLPQSFASRSPGQLSGGQKQRVCVTRALAATLTSRRMFDAISSAPRAIPGIG